MKAILKNNKDLGHSYIDFIQMFEKKLKQITVNLHSRKTLLNQYKNSEFTHHPIPFHESPTCTIYGSFENSNIHAVSQEGEFINVLLSSDTNTNGCTQWFYFGIKAHQLQTLRIRILNNRRSKSLLTKYNHIHVFDQGKWDVGNTTDLFYYRTNINHPFYHNDDQQIAQLQTIYSLYTLEFSYKFTQTDSIVYFALAIPYTVKKLHKFLSTCTLKKKSICQTQLGLPIYQLKTPIKTREVIVILARQHPSETVGSWVCQELIRLLQEGHQIQEKYQFIIFPMVNPDGVFLGNSRCNFNGVDLNRKWDQPNQSIEPEVYYIQKQLRKFQIAFLIDLHGHSKKTNQFIYGCTTNIKHLSEYMKIKQFSRLLAQNNDIFSYKDCAFSVTADRLATARIAMWKKYKIPNSMTIETSLFGYGNKPFSSEDFTKMALNILNALLRYDDLQLKEIFEPSELRRAMTFIKKEIFPQDAQESGSDSEAEQDLIVPKRHPRLKMTSRRDSTPGQLKLQSQTKIEKAKPSETPQLNHQSSVFFKNNHEQGYSFKRIPINTTKKVQAQKLQKIRSRMNSFQSQFIDEQPPLPAIHNIQRNAIRGALNLIEAIQVKSLFK